MTVELIRHTPDPVALVGEEAAICTASKDPDRARKGALASGHESILEHVTFTFRVEGVSRALLAQLTRHRIASFSVESQRYVRMDDPSFVCPDSMERGDMMGEIVMARQAIKRVYDKAIELGIPEEDARYILPNATTTRLIMTMNARELRHFFSLRCCNRAQWEIREMADRMLEKCRAVAPELFEGAGPGCVRGACPEGKRSCGQPRKEMQMDVNVYEKNALRISPEVRDMINYKDEPGNYDDLLYDMSMKVIKSNIEQALRRKLKRHPWRHGSGDQ